MRHYQKQLGLGVIIGVLVISICGCVSTLRPRMPAVLGLSVDRMALSSKPVGLWSKDRIFGLAIHSDATGREAAPPISLPLLSKLSQRIQVYLGQHCGVSEVKRIPRDGIQEGDEFSALLNAAKPHHIDALIVALFSSTESTHVGTFGESRMMTQMPGTTTFNVALVELGVIDVAQELVTFQVEKTATERMDRLKVPIGQGQGTLEEALDLLRANSAQQALDDALQDFTSGCLSD
ncbi:hypothetical protein [Candidatus Nitrospira salsa]